MFGISTTALGFGYSTRKGARAGAHFNSTITGSPHVSIHTNPAINIYGQTRRALTAKRSLRVNTATIHTDAWSLAFIDISAIATIGCQCKTRFANTFKAAVFVDAHAIETHVGGGTFIMINTILSIWSKLKASVTDTLKTSLGVDTATIAAHDSIHNAFINVDAGLFGGSSLVTFMTLAVIGSRCVDAVSINARITHTFIIINTLSADVLLVSHVTFTSITGRLLRSWDAASVQTQIGEMLAHVNSIIHRHSTYVLVI